MAQNNRIFFAVYQAGIAKIGSQTFTRIQGLQNVGLNTNFNLEQAYEIGQIQIFQNIENLPDIDITLEKLLDGSTPLYLQATNGAPDPSLVGRSNQQCIFAMDIFSDSQQSASGTPIAEVQVSGAFCNNFSYNFPVQGNFTETMGLIANNKVWTTGVGSFAFAGAFPGSEVPLALGASGGINRRQHMIFALPTGVTTLDVNGQVNATRQLPTTILPKQVDGINSSGLNVLNSAGHYPSYIQNISVSVDLGRTPLYQLGLKIPYTRYTQFPVAVRTEIQTIAFHGDLISATEAGVLGNGNNLPTETIKLATQEGLYIDLGTQNKLNTVTYGGADTGGTNQTITYGYLTFDDCTVYHNFDPSGF